MNNFKQTFKRFMSFMLITAFVLSIMPKVNVLADKQKPLTGTRITYESSQDNRYNFIMSWNKAEDSFVSDGDVSNIVDENGNTIFTYTIYSRKNESITRENIFATDEQKEKYQQNITAQLEPGVFNFYSVLASHQHYDAEGNISGSSDMIPLFEQEEVAFMSDIELDMTMNGNEATFEWSNPTIDKYSPFDSFVIYYGISDKNGNNTIDAGTKIEIPIERATLLANGNLAYKHVLSDLSVGKFYSFKIEPVYNGNTLRGVENNEQPISEIEVNNKIYQIAYTDPETNEFREDGIYINPNLYIETVNAKLIKLFWDNFDASSISTENFKIELYSDTALDGENLTANKKLIAIIESFDVVSWITDAPDSITYYQFVATAGNVVMTSNVAVYDNSYDNFLPYSPTIREVVAGQAQVPFFNIKWDSFLRLPLGDEEPNLEGVEFENLYEDKNVYYKAWITDSAENFQSPSMINYFFGLSQDETPLDALYLESQNFVYTDLDGKEQVTKVYDSESITAFQNINKYVSYENGYPEVRPLVENKVYYIKMQAFRKGVTEYASEPAYASIYIPNLDGIITTPEALQRPPLRIQLDENGAEVVTESTITIEWDKTWFEVSDQNEPSTWYTVLGVDPQGNLLLGEKATSNIIDKNKIVYLNNYHSPDQQQAIRNKLKNMGLDSYYADTVPLRFIDYTESNADIHVVKYDDVSSYEQYLASLNLDEDFQPISPNDEGTSFSYLVSSTSSGEALIPDTSYLIILRTYMEKNGEKYYTYHPQYVIGSTASIINIIPEKPTSPVLEILSTTDTTITLRYLTNDLYKNILKISNLKEDYSEGGVEILDDELRQNGKLVPIENSDEYYIYYTIPNLFPETTYYLWINNATPNETSSWSTFIDATTKELTAPPKPSGLSVISQETLDEINITNSLDYERIGQDYLILEWARIFIDNEEKAGGVTAYGIHEILQSVNDQVYVGAKFNELIAFKEYYSRVRTLLTVERNGLGSIVYYGYEIQISQYPDFLDKQTIIVYDTGLVPDGKDVLLATSEWSKEYVFKTSQDLDEYDGFNDPSKFPLPDQNFEIVYDEDSKTLDYIFRSGGKDANGNDNNFVDQRFISEMAKEGFYDFFIDLSTYGGQSNVIRRRNVVIPYSVLNAFNEYDTTLTVKYDNMVTTYDFTDFDDYMASQNVKAFGNNSKVTLKANNASVYNKLNNYQSVESDAKELDLGVTTPLTAKSIDRMPNDMDISLKLNSRASVLDYKVATYKAKDTSSSLQEIHSEYNNDEGTMNFKTKDLDIYTVLKTSSPLVTTSNDDYIYSMVSNFTINDVGSYSGSSSINTTQFNNIVASVAKNETSVNMNDSLSTEDYTNLGRSNLLVSGTMVSREEGISKVVNLYEKKTGNRLPEPNMSFIPSINTVSEENKANVAKAYELGLFDETEGFNYKENLTLNEMLYMIDLVLLDS